MTDGDDFDGDFDGDDFDGDFDGDDFDGGELEGDDGDGFDGGAEDPRVAELRSRIRAAVLSELEASGALPLRELARRVGRRPGLPHPAELGADDWEDAVDDVLLETDETWMSEAGVVWLLDDLLDGVVLTHRLGQDEKRHGLVALSPDLPGLGYGMDRPPLLRSGGALKVVFDNEGVEGADENGSLVGPPGWLDQFPGEALLAFRLAGRSVELTTVEVSDDAGADPRIGSLRAMFDELYDAGVGVEAEALLLEAIAEDPGPWRDPRPPVVDLLEAIGLELRGAWVGPRGEAWEHPATVWKRERTEDLAAQFGLDHCCLTALEAAEDAWTQFRSIELRRARGDMGASVDIDWRAVGRQLAHGNVLAAFFDGLAGAEEWVSAADRFADHMASLGGGLAAPACLLHALVAERQGRVLDAESHLRRAVVEDPAYGPALEDLARYAADRGDASQAAVLLRRSGAGPDDEGLRYLEGLETAVPRASRNDPCPCGSGKKFKVCCQRAPRLDTGRRTGWLYQRAALYAVRPERRAHLLDLVVDASEALPGSAGQVFPVLVDIALFEGGVLEDYLRERGVLLAPEDADLARSWIGTSLRLWEVADVRRGQDITLRDTGTGDELVAAERAASSALDVGDYVLARVVPAEGSHRVVGSPLDIGLQERQSVMALLDSDPDEHAIATWLGFAFAGPDMSNRDGEPLVLCTAVLQPVASRWRDIESRLDEIFERQDDGTWIEQGELDGGESVIRASLSRTDDGLRCETNSEERLERLLDTLAELLPDLELVDESYRPWKEVITERRGSDVGHSALPTVSPEALEAVDEYIRGRERAWVDESIPALGGLTPRQALDDPTRREDLERLLKQMEANQAALARRGPGPGAGFDAGRVRRLLGL